MTSSTEVAFDRDNLAKWHALRHLDIDSGVELVFHLPTNAPEREIRLLEVNRLILATTPLEPIDFGVDIDSSAAHTLYVLDVTPAQWESIQTGHLALPTGWTLGGSHELGSR